MSRVDILNAIAENRSAVRDHFSLSAAPLNPQSAFYLQTNAAAVDGPRELFENVGALLGSEPPFDQFRDGEIHYSNSPTSGGMLRLSHAARWLFAQSRVRPAEEALRDLEDFVKRNHATCLEVMPLWGLNPEEKVDLQIPEGIQLIPISALPPSQPTDELTDVNRFTRTYEPSLRLRPAPTVALVRKFNWGPIFIPKEKEIGGPDYSELMRELALCLTLLDRTAVSPVAHWFQLDPPPPVISPIGGAGGYALEWTFQSRTPPKAYDVTRTVTLIRCYLALGSRRASLFVPLSRLNAAIKTVDTRARALDLGIGLEALLLEPKTSPKKRTLAAKGAAWLGGSSNERAVNETKLRKLYELRSQVAHEGILPDQVEWEKNSTPTENALGEGIDMLVNIIEKVVLSGAFPK